MPIERIPAGRSERAWVLFLKILYPTHFELYMSDDLVGLRTLKVTHA